MLYGIDYRAGLDSWAVLLRVIPWLNGAFVGVAFEFSPPVANGPASTAVGKLDVYGTNAMEAPVL